jgi:PAS domain S-box
MTAASVRQDNQGDGGAGRKGGGAGRGRATRRDGARVRDVWERYHGVVVTVLVTILLAAVARGFGPVPLPSAFIVLSVAYASAAGGLWPGLAASLVGIVGYVLLLGGIGEASTSVQEPALRAIVGAITMPATALIVGLLKDTNDRLHREGVRAAVDARAREVEAESLRQSERRLRRLFDAGVVGMAYSNLSTRRITAANDQFLEMLGYSRQDLEQGRLDFASLRAPGWGEVAKRAGEELRPLKPTETEFLRKDGSRAALLIGAAVLDSGDEVISFVLDVSEQKRMEKDLAEASARQRRIAETLQRSLLLPPDEDSFPDLRVATFYEAASDEAKVGGDFFDAFPLEDGRVALVVGDVMGKGLVAATRTAEVRFALRAFLSDAPNDVAGAVGRLNRFLCAAHPVGLIAETSEEESAGELRPVRGFVCLALVVVDPRTGQAEALSAGAELPLVLRGSGAEPVEPVLDINDVREAGLCAMLGVDPETAFTTAPFAMAPEDTLLLLTDGLSEARPPGTVDFFAGEPLAASFRAAATRLPPAEAVGEVVECARRHAGGTLRDDVCLLMARRECQARRTS